MDGADLFLALWIVWSFRTHLAINITIDKAEQREHAFQSFSMFHYIRQANHLVSKAFLEFHLNKSL